MNNKPLQTMYKVLLFLLDTIHAWVLAVSASILFHAVLEYPFTDRKIMLIAGIATPLILLFLRSKYFRVVSLFAIGIASTSVVVLMILSFFYSSVRELWNYVIISIVDLVLVPDTPPLLIVLLAVMLSAIILTHGKRMVYLFVLAPPLAMIVLSMFSAEFPTIPLVVYTVAAIALVLRKKYDWFSKLLSQWPTTADMLNGTTADDAVRVNSSSVKSAPPSRKGLGFPNALVRALLLVVTAAIIALLFRPVQTPGPLFGDDVSRSIELKFQTLLESSDFLQRLFGVEIKRINTNPRKTGTYGKIGGPADLGDDPILLVKASSPGVYLRGFTYDDYMGNSWHLEPVNSSAEALNGEGNGLNTVYNEMENLIVTYNPIWLVNYTYYSSSLSEWYWNHHKQYVAAQYINPYDARFGVFVPGGSRMMRFFDEDMTYYIRPKDLHLKLSTGAGVLYDSSTAPAWIAYDAYYLTYDDSMILSNKLYSLCGPGYYRNMLRTMRDYGYGGYTGYGHYNELAELEKLARFSEEAAVKYTRLSGKVSSQVRSLAEQLTKDLEYQDDWHKAIAIKNFLLSGQFKYNLSPAELPNGVDVLDQFLFYEKEGYCTYFATAMTVLARAAGIPARYVEGFYVSSKTKTDDGLYLLTEQNLHAWCEIYIEGLGFVPMEATAGFGQISVPEATSTPVPTATPTLPPPTETPVPTDEEPTPGETAPEETLPPDDPTAELTPAPTEEPPPFEPKKMPTAIKILIIVLITAILIFAILYLLYRLSRRRPGRSGDDRERTSAVYRSASALLRRFGFRRNSAETPREFADRLASVSTGTKKDLPPEAIDSFAELTGAYEAALYSDSNTEAATYADALKCWKKLVSALEDRFGKLKTKFWLIGATRK